MEFRINEIGIRSGERITASSTGTQCRGSELIVRSKNPIVYPPSRVSVQAIDLTRIRDGLNTIDFFSKMSSESRSQWLDLHSQDNDDLYLSDIKDVEVKIISFNGKYVRECLSDDMISSLIRGNPGDPEGFWPLDYIYNLFPRKTSRARRHTLIFRPNNWIVKPKESLVRTYEGLYFTLSSGAIGMGKISGDKLLPLSFNINSQSYELMLNVDTGGSEPTVLRLLELFPELSLEVMRKFKLLIDWAPPSVLKSLLQKLIRTRCKSVSTSEGIFPSRECLTVTLICLICHPGAFVPDIQRFVRGLESAAKRLAVTINEDSFLEDGNVLTRLYLSSYAAQNVEGWWPTEQLIREWVIAGVMALEDNRMYQFNKTPKFDIIEWSPWACNYIILSAIKSFKSDIDMLASIMNFKGSPRDIIHIPFDEPMPLIHCIDQHCYTDLAHYVDPQHYNSYSELFGRIWREMSSWNPRTKRDDFIVGKLTPFQENLRGAQHNIWISKTTFPTIIKVPSSSPETIISYTLSDSWLASFVGPFEIMIGRMAVIVIIRPDNYNEMVAVKRPSRDDKETVELDEEQKIIAINTFKAHLSNGYPLNHVPSTLPMFKGLSVWLQNDIYYVGTKDGVTEWKNACVINMRVPAFDLPINSLKSDENIWNNYFEFCLKNTFDGCHINAHNLFKEYLETINPNVLRRSLLYLSSFNSKVELFHIGRDGTGTEYSVSPLDTNVNHLLSCIASLYPIALEKRGIGYMVKLGPCFWYLCKQIQSQLQGISSERLWKLGVPDERQLWDHQKDFIEELVRKREKKVKIIWLKMGMGKTAIITNYIQRLIASNEMPKYCLYTLPPSAIETVSAELTLLGLEWIHLDMRKTGGGAQSLHPFKINIIFHDHLRLSNLEIIREQANETLFINDEFHKTMASKTQRTSIALELAKLSANTVAMTGTLIKDDSVDELIAWLELAVDFEVTQKNYWVAISSIISRKVTTKVIVERISLEGEMSSEERALYLSTIPSKLGGSAIKINFKSALEVSYQAITRKIVERVLFYLSHGFGSFVVAKDLTHQDVLETEFRKRGITRIHKIRNNNFVNLTPKDKDMYQVVITTSHHSEGYNMTAFNVMISGIYFSNQATRDQIEHRINRLDQTSPLVRIENIHSGILSYIHQNYEKDHNLSMSLSNFAKSIEMDVSEISFS